jgi:hypothetical protein
MKMSHTEIFDKNNDGRTFTAVCKVYYEGKFTCDRCNGKGHDASHAMRDDGWEVMVGNDCLKALNLSEGSFHGLPIRREQKPPTRTRIRPKTEPASTPKILGADVGAKVKHETTLKHLSFGNGTIIEINYERKQIKVVFESGVKTLEYPGVFENGQLSLI